MSDSNQRPVRKPLSMKIEKWGLIEAWIAHNPAIRKIALEIGSSGFQATVQNGQQIESEPIAQEEDPATAMLRAIGKFR